MKRILTLVLALVLVLGLFPVISLAGYTYPVDLDLPLTSVYQSGGGFNWYWQHTWQPNPDNRTPGLTRTVLMAAKYICVEFSSQPPSGNIGFNLYYGTGQTTAENLVTVPVVTGETKYAIDIENHASKPLADTSNGYSIILSLPTGASSLVTKVYLSNSREEEIVEPEPVNKAALQTRYDALKDTSNANYTTISWSAFQLSLTAASGILANTNATQGDVDDALSALNSAFEGLTVQIERPEVVANYPFPQSDNITYAVERVMPTNRTQDEMNQDVINQFKKNLRDYVIEPGTANSDNPDEFRMALRHSSGGGASPMQITCSESMGYGMLMLALMAGSDEYFIDNATANQNLQTIGGVQLSIKDYFDGMFRTLMAFPSSGTGGSPSGRGKLMAWELVSTDPNNASINFPWKDTGSSASSATDGDMDMIAALLIADKQWGSDGRYDYNAYAQDMMRDMWRQIIDHNGSRTPYYYHMKVGNWVGTGSRSNGTRPSDFILSHLKAYEALDTNPANEWQKTIDVTYKAIADITQKQTTVNGLLPGFAAVDRATGIWDHVENGVSWLEGTSDSRYDYNACRVPWRLATDYLLYGDTTIATDRPIGTTSLLNTCLQPLHNFLLGTASGNTAGTFSGIRRNFYMDGTSGSNGNTSYRAPVLVSAAAVGTPAQMTDGWNLCRGINHTGDFYGDYINILSMITASGNYWDAAKLPGTEEPEPEILCEVRPIETPVAGHYPSSLFKYPYKANKYNNTSTNASVGNGFAQTLTWEPAIEDTFLPSTEYTVTLLLEPNSGWTNCGMPGTTRSFSANDIKPANIEGLPTEGVKNTSWSYEGANLVIDITFNATEAEVSEADLIFYEDFSKGVHDDKTVGEGAFMLAQQANRQDMSRWRDEMTSVRTRADGGSELVLGYKVDPSATNSSNAYIKNNFVTAGGVRTRGRTTAQGGGAKGLDDIIFENAYGYYEANIKFPQAEVVWGAFWLFSPATAAAMNIDDGGSKYATEIDIIESIGTLAGKGYNAAYHTYRSSADRNNTTGLRRDNARNLYRPGDVGWATATRMSASEEVSIETNAAKTGVNIYDGEFHKIALEWTPTDYIFYVDGVEFGSWQNLSTHYSNFGTAYSDWPVILQNEGVMQNPAYIKLTVEAAEWADESRGNAAWGSSPDNPWAPDRRLGVSPDQGEMVVDYVKVWNGPKPEDVEEPEPTLEWPFTAIDWVLFKMNGIDIAKYGYDQYDEIFLVKRALGVSGFGSMGSSAVSVASGDRSKFTSAAGEYYDKYQNMLDQEAQMIKLWLADLATPQPGEDWQHHMSRIAQTEYMFTDAPGYYGLVEANRRVSVLGAADFYDNVDANKIMDFQETYEQKFQAECYRPGKVIEKAIDYMDPADAAEVATVRAAYDALDNLTKSCIMNYQKLTRAEGLVEADGTDKLESNIVSVGMRKPTGTDSSFTAANQQAALADLLKAAPGANPWYIWISGVSNGTLMAGTTDWNVLEASGCLKYPKEYYQAMGISLTADPVGDAFFAYLDENFPDAEVYLQVENMSRLVEPQMDVLSHRAKQFNCIKGFAIDVEWYNHSSTDCGLKVSDYRAQVLNEDIYTWWGPEYSLALKHYDAHHMPTTYRGGTDGKSNPIIFVDDTQNYGSWDGSHGGRYNAPGVGDGMMPGNGNDWAMFAEFFYPNPVIFQTGYQHDQQWSYAMDDPIMRSYINKCGEVVADDQPVGIAWVNFNRNGYPEFPTAGLRTPAQYLTELATRTIAYLSNYNGDSNNLLGGNWGYFSNANGGLRPNNNPLTVYDALWVSNVRNYANILIDMGAPAANFTGHTNYSRFVAIEPRAVDIRIAHLKDIIDNAGGYKVTRDEATLQAIIDTYDALTEDQKAQVTGYHDLLIQLACADLTWDLIKGENTAQDCIEFDLDLPLSGLYGTEISWAGPMISGTGVVNRLYGFGNLPTVLTATVSLNGQQSTVTFDMIIMEKDKEADPPKLALAPDQPSTVSLKVGATGQILLDSNVIALYLSSAPATVSVNQSGLITGLKAGIAVITVRNVTDPSMVISIVVNCIK